MICLHEPLLSGKEWKYIKKCLDQAWISSSGKYVNIFDCIHIYAEQSISDQKVLHAAAIAAELLDNNEDGIIEERREPLLGHYLAGIDVDHGGCGGLDQGCKGETHLLATVGNNPRRGLRCRGIGIIPSRRQRGGHAQNRSQQPRQ